MTSRSEGDDRITEWTGPPANGRPHRYRAYTEATAALRQRPGQWARLGDRSSPSAAYQFALGVRKGRPTAFRPAGEYEGAFQGRSVYVRYLGVQEGIDENELMPEFVDGHVESDPNPMDNVRREQTNAVRERREVERRQVTAPDAEHLFTF